MREAPILLVVSNANVVPEVFAVNISSVPLTEAVTPINVFELIRVLIALATTVPDSITDELWVNDMLLILTLYSSLTAELPSVNSIEDRCL